MDAGGSPNKLGPPPCHPHRDWRLSAKLTIGGKPPHYVGPPIYNLYIRLYYRTLL